MTFDLISNCSGFIPDFIVKGRKKDTLDRGPDNKESRSGMSGPVSSLCNCFLGYISIPLFAYYLLELCIVTSSENNATFYSWEYTTKRTNVISL